MLAKRISRIEICTHSAALATEPRVRLSSAILQADRLQPLVMANLKTKLPLGSISVGSPDVHKLVSASASSMLSIGSQL